MASALLLLAGCASGYEQFFQASGAGLKDDRVLYHSEPARLVRGNSGPQAQTEDLLRMWEQGYILIGSSSFNGASMGTDTSLAVSYGNKIGAGIVLFYSQYESTHVGSTTTTTPVTSTTVAPSGRTYTTTSYIPQESTYSVARYDYLARYFAKIKETGSGLYAFPLSREEQQAFGTNKGLVVRAVRRGSSGYEAEILPGDLLLMIDGKVIDSGDTFTRLLADKKGQEVTFTIRRKSGEITKRVLLRVG